MLSTVMSQLNDDDDDDDDTAYIQWGTCLGLLFSYLCGSSSTFLNLVMRYYSIMCWAKAPPAVVWSLRTREHARTHTHTSPKRTQTHFLLDIPDRPGSARDLPQLGC